MLLNLKWLAILPCFVLASTGIDAHDIGGHNQRYINRVYKKSSYDENKHSFNRSTKLHLKGSVIYYSPVQEGLNLLGISTPDPSLAANLESIDLSYMPGFRIGAGFFLGKWNLNAEYSCLVGKTSVHPMAAISSVQFFSPSGVHVRPVTTPLLTQSLFFGYNNLNIYLNKGIFVDLYTLLSPYLGIQLNWQEKRSDLNALSELTHTVRSIGVRSGLSSFYTFPFYPRLSLTGSSGISLLHGRVHHASNYVTDGIFVHRYTTVFPSFESKVGLSWDRFLGEKHEYHLGIEVNYESHLFLYSNNYPLILQKKSSVTGFSGVSLGFRFDF